MGISVQSLSKRYGTTSALEGVTFEIPDGKILSVLGPSGSGKTTLLRCIAGVEEPEAGRISVGPKVVFDASKGVNVPPEERGIGMVFQSNALWPHMTVKKNVAYPLEVRGDKEVDAKVAEVLTLLKMESLASRYPSEISGGEQQRVTIARAIVYRPSLVLLDEPFSSLDVLLRESLRDEIRQLQLRYEMNMVYVTHDRVDALSLGDITGVMAGGRIMACGYSDDLMTSPPNSYTARFLGGMLVLDGVGAHSAPGVLRVDTELGAFNVPSTRSPGKLKLCIPPSACSVAGASTDSGLDAVVTGVVRFPSGRRGIRASTSAGVVEVPLAKEVSAASPGDRVSLALDLRKVLALDA